MLLCCLKLLEDMEGGKEVAEREAYSRQHAAGCAAVQIEAEAGESW
jgi:hypothetical protein